MTPLSIFSLVPVLIGLFAADQVGIQSVTRLVIQDEVIMRVPVDPRPRRPDIEWVEHDGPRCIPSGMIQRALLAGSEQVDFVLANRQRVRAQLDEDCPALDFYAGFYLQQRDERLCSGRDAIHSRMGGSCTILQFKMLSARLKR